MSPVTKQLPQEQLLVRRIRWLTQVLIVSGTLNIGLVATFAYFVLKDRQASFSIVERSPLTIAQPLLKNADLLHRYSLLSYADLLMCLESKELVEEGLTKRDLALACLVAFHHFHLEQALGGFATQQRKISLTNSDGQETIDIPLFLGLADHQFEAILNYSRIEKWPFTSQGLFYELKSSVAPVDPSLIDAFCLTAEYHALYAFLTKTGIAITRGEVIALVCEGEWQVLAAFTQQQRWGLDFSVERRRALLIEYLVGHSRTAAKLLVDHDAQFIVRRLDDMQILTVLDLYPGHSVALENIAKSLLLSTRTDPVWMRAAAVLYAGAGEAMPEPYSHINTLKRFLPDSAVKETEALPSIMPALVDTGVAHVKTHTVAPGENLWKIARRYHVSIHAIMEANHLSSEKLRPGKQLKIPAPQ